VPGYFFSVARRLAKQGYVPEYEIGTGELLDHVEKLGVASVVSEFPIVVEHGGHELMQLGVVANEVVDVPTQSLEGVRGERVVGDDEAILVESAELFFSQHALGPQAWRACFTDVARSGSPLESTTVGASDVSARTNSHGGKP
jgi:hypothetical protein